MNITGKRQPGQLIEDCLEVMRSLPYGGSLTGGEYTRDAFIQAWIAKKRGRRLCYMGVDNKGHWRGVLADTPETLKARAAQLREQAARLERIAEKGVEQ